MTWKKAQFTFPVSHVHDMKKRQIHVSSHSLRGVGGGNSCQKPVLVSFQCRKKLIQIDIFRNKKRDEKKCIVDNQGFFFLFFDKFQVSVIQTFCICNWVGSEYRMFFREKKWNEIAIRISLTFAFLLHAMFWLSMDCVTLQDFSKMYCSKLFILQLI